MEISFYGVLNTPLEKIIVKLLEKSYAIKKETLLIVESDEEVKRLDNILWTSSFWLPHNKIEEQESINAPIVIATRDNYSFLDDKKYSYLFLINNIDIDNKENFEKIFVIFDLKNDIILGYNRERWQGFKNDGLSVNFYKQDKQGKFVKHNEK